MPAAYRSRLCCWLTLSPALSRGERGKGGCSGFEGGFDEGLGVLLEGVAGFRVGIDHVAAGVGVEGEAVGWGGLGDLGEQEGVGEVGGDDVVEAVDDEDAGGGVQREELP